jgi:hypothetical protein
VPRNDVDDSELCPHFRARLSLPETRFGHPYPLASRGFETFWRWKSRSRRGQPAIPREIRDLIREGNRANGCGVRRDLHGELLKLVSLPKYMARRRSATHTAQSAAVWMATYRRSWVRNHPCDPGEFVGQGNGCNVAVGALKQTFEPVTNGPVALLRRTRRGSTASAANGCRAC